ncbi:hypothetical protein F4778DRAFT_745748 [Xylariomycetidae sp. FL2044]|nr:hypothetical protein F4778DRAFT_745748 [Xylariomycetidae sp. FL2044]
MYRYLSKKAGVDVQRTRGANEKVNYSTVLRESKDADEARGIITMALAKRLSQALASYAFGRHRGYPTGPLVRRGLALCR